MNPDEHLHDHLSALAGAIELTPGDLADVRRRGARRRNRRRAAVAGVSVVALAATTFTVVDTGDDDRSTVESDVAASVVASSYDWTVVEPTSGLGYSDATATVGSSIYRISTAPGPGGDLSSEFEPHLYRSDDGAEWAEVSLPTGVRPSTLAATDGALYAVGTAPAGGDARELVMAASTDGAATWRTVTLPADVADLDRRFPGQIHISQPSIAALDDQRLVAAVVVSAVPDVASLVPGIDPEGGWETTPDGVVVYDLVPCDDDACAPEGREQAEAEQEATAASGDVTGVPRGERMEPEVRATYTWDELGIDPELRALIGGRAYVYASDDGATFERVDVPGAEQTGWSAQVVATDAGYHLFLGSPDGSDGITNVVHSSDGRTWTDAGSFPGYAATVGKVAGRPAVALWGNADGVNVRIGEADGTWRQVDLRAAVAADEVAGFIGDVAFGPLGMAAHIVTGEDQDEQLLVHSTDGVTLSTVRIDEHMTGGSLLGIDVTADAIRARWSDDPDGDPSTAPTTRVLVGTPR